MAKYSHRDKSNKPVIGLFIENAAAFYQTGLLIGVNETVKNRGASLICVPGYGADEPSVASGFNALYNHISAADLDGLIVPSSPSSTLTQDKFTELSRRYSPMPMVSIGKINDHIPAVTVDNESGFKNLLHHLLEMHRYRNLVFVRGPKDNENSNGLHRVFAEVMEEFGFIVDQRNVIFQEQTKDGGERAVATLLDYRKIPCDAIVTASDEIALGVMNALSLRDIRVPYDIAVTGFDDTEESGFVTPPLTTVRQPLYNIGVQAAETILDLIEGKAISNRVFLSTDIIIRQSCGCAYGANVEKIIARHSYEQKRRPRGAPAIQEDHIIHEMMEVVSQASSPLKKMPADADSARRIFRSFFVDVKQKLKNVFLPVLDDVVRDTIAHGGEATAWQDALWVLQNYAAEILTVAEIRIAESLLQQARLSIAEAARRAVGFNKLQEQSLIVTIRKLVQLLSTSFDLERLITLIADGLCSIGISRGHLVLCGEKAGALVLPSLLAGPHPSSGSILVLSYDGHKRLRFDTGGYMFPGNQLLPSEMLKRDHQFSLVVMPLLLGGELSGYLVLETQSSRFPLFEILAEQISSALNAAILVQKIQDQTNDIAISNRQLEWEILQRKKAQEELIAAKDAAENANKYKSLFLASMSHELRTPLNSIVGFSEMLTEDAMEKRDEILVKDLQKIRGSAIHLRAIVNDILDLSKIEAGKMSLYLEDFDVGLVVTEAFETLKPQITNSNVEIRHFFDKEIGTMHADMTKVRQLVLNILSNAIKFTKEGSVSLTVKRITNYHADWIYFIITDTGIGMTNEQVAHVFEKFTQAEASTSRNYGGTGLGLAISKSLCKLMGGDIAVKSAIGVGTEFTIMLPAIVVSVDTKEEP